MVFNVGEERKGEYFMIAMPDSVKSFIRQLLEAEKEKSVEEVYRFMFNELFGEPLDDREARFVEKYPFVKNKPL